MQKHRNRANTIFIILFLIIFIFMTFYYVMLSKAIADYTPFTGSILKFKSFGISFNSLLSDKKQQMLYLYFEFISLLILGYFLYTKISKPDKFESAEIEITPDIKIPAPAGQGQFGKAWFLDDIFKTTKKKPFFIKELLYKNIKIGFIRDLFKTTKKEVFKYNIIDKNNSKIKELYNTGDSDIKDIIDKLNNGVDILDIEKDIKNELKENEQKKKEEYNNKYFEDYFKDDETFDTNMYDIDFSYDIESSEKLEEAFNLDELSEPIDVEREFIKSKALEIEKENTEALKKEKPYDPKSDKNKIFKSSGLIVGVYNDEKENKEYTYYVDSDTHSVVLGATRSGKSRCVVLPSIGNLALAGESIVVTDPKGELYAYTSGFMKKLGYEVICLDFKNAKKSSKYNLLQPIINASNDKTPEHPNGDIELIVKYSEELSNMMFKETKGENPMWVDNAKSMVTGAILSLVLENNDESIQNISNVYRFIMNGEGKDISPEIDNQYLFIKALQMAKPESPIIDTMLQIVNSPKETRGGFTSNAGASTRLFTQPSIWEITHTSNVDLSKMGEKKQILYFVLPDQDTSYYKIVSIIVKQMYNELVKVSDRYGGRLPIRVNFLLDEFGNFAPIPDLATLLTVAGGRGMRFNFFIQGFPQITQKYDKETTEIVKSNCETWVYLKAMDTATLDEISKKIGSYTIYSNSESMSIQNNMTTSGSSSQSLQKRSLLLPEEIQKINRPYLLVMYGNNKPAINKAPDISQLTYNKFFGLGDEKHNNQLRMVRDKLRPNISTEDKILYWNIFKDLKDYIDANNPYGQELTESKITGIIAQYIIDKEKELKGEQI